MKNMLRDFDNALFRYGSPVTLGVLRIVFGFMVLCNWLIMLPNVMNWFSEKGYVPVQAAMRWNGDAPRFNPFANVTDPTLIMVLYGLLILFTITTIVGFQTRISTILLAIFTVGFHMRNPIILYGGDTLLRVSVIMMAIAPMGAAVSLDRRIAVAKGKAPAIPLDISIWPQRLFQWQLAVLYITSCWNKWHGSYWQDGTATYYSLRLTEFEKFPVPEFAKHMPWLAVTTWGTLIIQMAMGTLVFARPFRNYALIGGLILHFSLEYVVNVPIFQWIITSLYVSHIDGEEWVRLWNKWSTKRFGGQAVPEVAE